MDKAPPRISQLSGMGWVTETLNTPGECHRMFHIRRQVLLHPPQDKYYVVDAGYPNRPGYLSPYKGERYHLPEWHRGIEPNTPTEKFNRIHSSVRNVIERSF